MGELPGSYFQQVQVPHVARLHHFWPLSDCETATLELLFPGINHIGRGLLASARVAPEALQICGLPESFKATAHYGCSLN